MPRLRRTSLAVLTLAASFVWVVACSSAPPQAPTPAAAPTSVAPRPESSTLTISAPGAGQSIPAGSVQIMVAYSGPQLVPGANAAKLNDYHLHYLLDEDPGQYLGTLAPLPMGNPHIVHSAALQVSFDNVSAGPHTVSVMLSGANHISVAPPLSAQVKFTAQ